MCFHTNYFFVCMLLYLLPQPMNLANLYFCLFCSWTKDSAYRNAKCVFVLSYRWWTRKAASIWRLFSARRSSFGTVGKPFSFRGCFPSLSFDSIFASWFWSFALMAPEAVAREPWIGFCRFSSITLPLNPKFSFQNCPSNLLKIECIKLISFSCSPAMGCSP